MEYTPVPTAFPVTQPLQTRDDTGRALSTASTLHNKAQQHIALQQLSSGPTASRYESTYTLIGADDARNPDHLSGCAAHKPFFLHPSMWMWEVLSVSLSASVFIAIIIVLAIYDGKTSPIVWGVTLNTMIAVAATLFRICLMVPVSDCICQLTWVWLQKDYKPLQDIIKFDMASRGPLGSLQLLWGFKRGPIVSVASIIVIIGIAIGPLLQQSVVFYSANVPCVGACVKELTAYASAAFTYTYPGVSFSLESAVYSGLYSSGMISLPYPPYSCPTGNCTWDPFPTLGVSVQCFDDAVNYCSPTDSISWSMHSFPRCHTAAPDRVDQEWNSSWLSNVWYSYWASSLRSSGKDDPPYNFSDFDYGFGEESQDTWTSINAGFVAFHWFRAYDILTFVNTSSDSIITSNSTGDSGHCLFYIDMQVISAEVQNGVYKEHVLNSTTRIQPYKNLEYSGIPPGLDPKQQIGANEHANLTYTYLPKCQNSTLSDQCELGHDSKPVNITIPRQRYTEIMAILTMFLPRLNVTYGHTEPQDSFQYDTDGNIVILGVNFGPGGILNRSPNIKETMHTIAHYMTVALRVNATLLERQNKPNNSAHFPAEYLTPSHLVNGTVYIQSVHLHVRWGWLAFPAALLLIVAGILFETIRTSRLEAIGVWKSNSLAVLLSTQWKPEAGTMGATTSDELEKIAKGLEARVVQGAGLADTKPSVVIRNKQE